jgi:hypothetical protein
MTDADAGSGPADTERVWLVEREYDDGGMVTLVYATPDGTRRERTQFSAAYLESRSITAARDVSVEDLDPTPEGDRERYRTEARRVRSRNDPDDEL